MTDIVVGVFLAAVLFIMLGAFILFVVGSLIPNTMKSIFDRLDAALTRKVQGHD